MPKDSALALRAFFSLFIAIALLDATVLAQPVAKPNIVLIMADDAGYADFGFMNQFTGRTTPFKTPRLDQLAAESVKFSNAYVPSSICAVTRAGIMTGRQPDSFGFSYNALPEDLPYEGLPVSEKTILERVKELGYSTGVIGKWHLGEQPQWVPTARGADYFFGIYEGHINYYPNPTSATQIRRGTEIVQWASEPSFNNIAPDPTRGRYLTDALGDEASQFISQKAAAAEPFLLYAALNAPHTPYDTKAQDYAQFPSLTGQRRAVAAMTLSMDRAIGNIMDRINDPNGDGDQSDSIADNTVIIFLNDNGGPNSAYDNGPLAGTKGSAWEGGIRTPMLVKAPNVAPGVFDNVVSGLDLFSTIEGLARSPTMTPAYGKDLMPFLRGEQTGVVHEALVTRNRGNFAAVRVGAWKLVKPDASTTWKLFHLNTDGSGEDVDLQLQYPEIVEALTKEYVKVDVTLDKPRNSGPAKVRNYDLFIRRNDLGATNYWTDTNSWLNGENPSVVTGISRDEPCPNFKVAFTVNSASDYRSINNANRSSGLTRAQLAQGLKDLPGLGEVMLNEIRLQGNFAGTTNRKATIEGKTLMFVNDLSGKSPAIRLDATQSSATANYTFNVDLDMFLYHDLELVGDGNAMFRIGGAMSSFDPVSGVRKKGTSTVTLSGRNTFTGKLNVDAGKVIIDGVAAAIDGAQEVKVAAGAQLTLQSGMIRTPNLDIAQGTFQMLGGKLQAQSIVGNLTHSAGTVVFGSAVGPSTVWGNFGQSGGELIAHVSAATAVPGSAGPPAATPTIAMIQGAANLAGKLIVEFEPAIYLPVGTTVHVLEALGGVQGTFSQFALQGAPAGSQWSLGYTSNAVTLLRLENSFNSADFDGNGIVDGRDFLIWQRNSGKQTSLGDANGDGIVNAADLGILKSQFGGAPPTGSSVHATPEPGCGTLVAIAGTAFGAIRRSRSRRRSC